MRLRGTVARDAGGQHAIKTTPVALGIKALDEIEVPITDILEEYEGKDVSLEIIEIKDGKPCYSAEDQLDRDVDLIAHARELRERLLGDPHRPGYHLVVPEDIGRPGDPNGAFFAAGRYHLMYLYHRRHVGFCWGHVSSHDLVHWRHHPDAIGPGDGDDGCFSGGAFVDDDGTAYLTYWRLDGPKGIGIAWSRGPSYDAWTKHPRPAIPATAFGIWETRRADGTRQVLACADPSNIWKKDGTYYMQAGNLIVLNEHGRDPTNPLHATMRGDWVDLYTSADLDRWDHVHRFYDRRQDDSWTDASEDDMCPSFLPLPASKDGGPPSDKHLQLFISHNKGCQYYIGDYDKAADTFLPRVHGRMSWVDNTFFAPEALIDGKGRQVMWAWLLDNPGTERQELRQGWSGVYCLPRVLWLGGDGTLRMAVAPEMEALRCNQQVFPGGMIPGGIPRVLPLANGKSFELRLTIDPGACTRAGVAVLASPGQEEVTRVYHDAGKGCLAFDARTSSRDARGRPVLEEAPFTLRPGEPLELHVFVDRCVVEVFANDRQAITRRVFPARDDSTGVHLFCEGGDARVSRAEAWELAPSNPW